MMDAIVGEKMSTTPNKNWDEIHLVNEKALLETVDRAKLRT